jgi:hypothetical protein
MGFDRKSHIRLLCFVPAGTIKLMPLPINNPIYSASVYAANYVKL